MYTIFIFLGSIVQDKKMLKKDYGGKQVPLFAVHYFSYEPYKHQAFNNYSPYVTAYILSKISARKSLN